MNKKINKPIKGAGRRLAEKLNQLGKKSPPAELVNKINKQEELPKVAKPLRDAEV